MKIYADILFFMNFYADFLCLSLAGTFIKKKVLPIRRLLGAFLGGIFGVVAFYPDMSFQNSFLLSFVFSLAIGLATFLPCKASELFKGLFFMYAFSFLFSGIMSFVLLNFGGGVIKNGVFYTKEIVFIPTMYFAYRGIILLKSFFVKRISEKICQVKICYNGKIIKADGFFDTGNNLCDPITGKKALMIDESILKKLIDNKCRADNLEEWVADGIRVIPYKTVADSGILFGFFSDYIVVDNKKIDKALLCVSRESLAYPVILQTGI